MNSFAPRTNGETAAGDVDVGAAAQRSSNSPSTGGSSDTDLTAPDVDAPIPGSKHATLNGYGNGNGTPSAVPTLGLVSDLWHAHLEPLDPSTPSRCQQSSPAEHQAWDRFVSIKPTLNLALRKPHSSLSCLRAPPWYNSGSLPSPSAIYLWRSDLAAQFDLLPMGSAAEMLCFKFLVRTKWDRGLQDRIIFGQHLEEQRRNRHKALLRRRTGRSASSSPERAPVLGIFTGVAEAESEHRSPSASRSEDGSQASASSSQQQQQGEEQQEEEDQWDKWCRMHGTNPQNELYDFAGFASHNPHSMYHKVKYGEWGSPHPYVPFAITNPAEFQASRKDQEAQESAALLWLAQRRNIASTQRQLDAHAAALRASSSNGSGAGASASAAGTAVSVANPPTVSVAVPDEEVIDQELEQPQAMGRQAVKDAVKPVAPASQQQPQPPAGIAAATSHTNPITVSVLIPDNLMPWIREHVYAQLVGRVDPALLAYWCNEDERRLPWPGKAKEEEEQDQSASARRSGLPARIPPVVNIAAVVTDDELPWRSPDLHGPSFRYPGDEEYAASRSLAGPASGARWSTRRAASHPPAPASFKIGNLFLSSCPGKKVRLTGAVRGRGAVCRDLGVDLKRFKELGVGTLVCCLSDAELGVIGVRWEEYVREADALGVDLVRVPMVEGNCPTSTSSLSHWLDEIITHCTLKGINVLVHCRGGVGRAGLVAACWLIKMGFVDEHRPISECAIRGSMWPEAEMMWQALQVVRLRRSSKAIETAEQAEVAEMGRGWGTYPSRGNIVPW
ncbi:hypothetical protein BDZ90DRAFT_274683 [Jaminaea rosea]|uniref:Tyrosine specific protein phosphatases domain-containing protein n=1 Tax=Jaminaea rosea TaxID=1569628 RepID=A0A316UXJ9_9BASI|nr:hypothetical protein BDZ90DRAFT_274683 [Jaminaea rosea]PWN27865.1 hypothetical protein BDZ90DRAFT_274683 [Jaminaea rosea]